MGALRAWERATVKAVRLRIDIFLFSKVKKGDLLRRGDHIHIHAELITSFN